MTSTALAPPTEFALDAISLAKPHEPTGRREPTLRELFDELEGPLLRQAMLLVTRRAVAEEIVQEAFLSLHRCWNEVQTPGAWLFRSVRNAALKHLRDNKRLLVGDSPPEQASQEFESTLQRREAAAVLREFVEALPSEDRELLQLKYYESLKYRDIAERTGLSVGNVGYRLHHLLKGLAARLREYGIDQVP